MFLRGLIFFLNTQIGPQDDDSGSSTIPDDKLEHY